MVDKNEASNSNSEKREEKESKNSVYRKQTVNTQSSGNLYNLQPLKEKQDDYYPPVEQTAGPGTYNIPSLFDKDSIKLGRRAPSFTFAGKDSEKRFITKAHLGVLRGSQSPGSCAYSPEYESTAAHSPSAKLPKCRTERNSVNTGLSPGPIYEYHSPHDISNPIRAKKGPVIKKDYMTELPVYIESSPAACDYALTNTFHQKGKGFSMGPDRKSSPLRTLWEKGITLRQQQGNTRKTPGPGSYGTLTELNIPKVKAGIFNKSSKDILNQEEYTKNLGPGKYNMNYENMLKNYGSAVFITSNRAVDVTKWGHGYVRNSMKQILSNSLSLYHPRI